MRRTESEAMISEVSTRTEAWQMVTQPEAVKLLLEPDKRQFFEPFLLAAHSTRMIADRYKLSLNAAYYRIKQLEKAGLLKVDRLERRAGRAIKYYRATATGFFVPFTATSSETFSRFLSQQLVPLHEQFYSLVSRTAQALVQAIGEVGYRVYDAGGYVDWDFSPKGHSFDLRAGFLAPDSPALLVAAETVRLPGENAKALQRD